MPIVCLLSGITADGCCCFFPNLFVHIILCIICEADGVDPLLLNRYQPTRMGVWASRKVGLGLNFIHKSNKCCLLIKQALISPRATRLVVSPGPPFQDSQ